MESDYLCAYCLRPIHYGPVCLCEQHGYLCCGESDYREYDKGAWEWSIENFWRCPLCGEEMSSRVLFQKARRHAVITDFA